MYNYCYYKYHLQVPRNIIHSHRRIKKRELAVYMEKKQRVIVFQWNPSAAFLNLIYTAVVGTRVKLLPLRRDMKF